MKTVMRNSFALAAAASLVFASTAAQAEVRPEQTTFAVVVDDDYVGEEPPGWLWGGVGVLVTLGLLVLLSGGSDNTNGQPNSPR